MLTLFNNLKDAEALCTKVHEYLQQYCPGYSASKWQEPVKHATAELWYVQLPVEYPYKDKIVEAKTYLPTAAIDIFCLAQKTKAVEEVEKLPDGFIEIKDVIAEIPVKK